MKFFMCIFLSALALSELAHAASTQTTTEPELLTESQQILDDLSGLLGSNFNKVEKYLKIQLRCKDQSGISREKYDSINDGEDDINDANSKQYVVCFLTKTGILDSNRNFDKERVKTVLRGGGHLFKKELKCMKKKSTLEETARHFSKCFNKF